MLITPPRNETLVCFANSQKLGGRCLAGKIYTDGKFSEWIRPISARETEELSRSEIQMSNGTVPAILDLISVPLLAHKPSNLQRENWLIDTSAKISKIGQLAPMAAVGAVDDVKILWNLGSNSVNGLNDKAIPENLTNIQSSLYLIRVSSLKIVIHDEYGRRAHRGSFSHSGNNYVLKITDLVLEQSFKDHPYGTYTYNECLLTLSLAEKLWYGFHYKLIAGVIRLGEEK
jgi:hypothetical protein